MATVLYINWAFKFNIMRYDEEPVKAMTRWLCANVGRSNNLAVIGSIPNNDGRYNYSVHSWDGETFIPVEHSVTTCSERHREFFVSKVQHYLYHDNIIPTEGWDPSYRLIYSDTGDGWTRVASTITTSMEVFKSSVNPFPTCGKMAIEIEDDALAIQFKLLFSEHLTSS